MVGLKNGDIHKNLTLYGEPQRYSWNAEEEEDCYARYQALKRSELIDDFQILLLKYPWFVCFLNPKHMYTQTQNASATNTYQG